MKISLDWLRDYVDCPDTPEQIAQTFTDVGFPVEDIQQVGDDWMLDVEITSNRPDCLGHIGLARELAAAKGLTLKMPDVSFTETSKKVTEWTAIDNQAHDLCARYTARIIDDVKIAPSPDWMVRRLETVGLRGISNVVDITNYVLLEIGQPLHSFDYDKLNQGRIIVRRAKNGEQMVTIDQSKVELNDSMLVIADASEPVALAGVMGGLPSEVTEQTRTVLLESAHFEPLCIRRCSRTFTIATEASYRFERNVDLIAVEWASRRSAALLAQLADGKVAAGVIDAGIRIPPPTTITLRLERLNTLLGIELESDLVVSILQRLGLEPQLDAAWGEIACTAPSWRGDLTREIDLIEEVIRIHGFDNIPTEDKIHLSVVIPDKYQRTTKKITTALNACGFYETISVSFIEDHYWKPFMTADFTPVRIRDLSRKTNNTLRPTLLPSLMVARKRNQDAGNQRCDIYELAATHNPSDGQPLPKEDIMLALLTDGDFQDIRGVIESVIGSLDKNITISCVPAEILWAAPETGAKILIGENVIGCAGKADSKIIEVFDLNQDAHLAEIDVAQLAEIEQTTTILKPLARYPGSMRDLSLVLDESVRWSAIEQEIFGLQIEELEALNFVGIYRGKGIEPGRKSLTLSMMFRRTDQTLTGEQVDAQQDRVLARLKEKFAAELRA